MIIKSCFNEHAQATVSALDFVIYKYGNCSWFNSNLRKIMLDMHIIPKHESFKKPLIIFHENGHMLGYSGYHYILHEIERCHQLFNIQWYSLYAIKIFTAMVLILLLFCIIYHQELHGGVIVDGQRWKHGMPK